MTRFAPLATAMLLTAACATGASGASESQDGPPTIVVTANIWADVVGNLACDDTAVVLDLLPRGADPHAFEPSIGERAEMDNAGLIVANGLGLEERLEDTLHALEEAGTVVFVMTDHVETIELPRGANGGHHDHGHGDDDHGDNDGNDRHEEEEGEEEGHDGGDDHGHDHGGPNNQDPHIWLDPVRVANALPELADAIAEIDGIAAADIDACLETYLAELDAAHEQIEALVATLPAEQRLLVSNHQTMGYFADRYSFDVVGSVIPSASTSAEASVAHLRELAEFVEHNNVRAIFGETSHEGKTAHALAEQLGVEVVVLATESLGEPGSPSETYLGLLTSNAELIVDALQQGN